MYARMLIYRKKCIFIVTSELENQEILKSVLYNAPVFCFSVLTTCVT